MSDPGKTWDALAIKQEINELGRQIIREAFRLKHSYDILARDPVDQSRLEAFEADPKQHGPGVRNTWLDICGKTTKGLKLSKWNRSLQHKLVQLALKIVAACPDQRRFGTKKIDWKSLIERRLYDLFYLLSKAYPLPGESPETAEERLLNGYMNELKSKGEVEHRRAKYTVRRSVAAIMVAVSRARDDEDALAFWKYVWDVVTMLGTNGMSEDELVTESVVEGGQSTRQSFRHVFTSSWRHPAVSDLFDYVDRTRFVEGHIFQLSRLKPGRRVHVDKVSQRRAPPGLPKSFFKPGFFDKMEEWEVESYKLREPDYLLKVLKTSLHV
ncbi:hypothetical protein EUX98_g8481 [Antrodiella citrinella]|uniref:Uncharacterized protein n=1 Tax=Antrodiella citrinella TaxID=2447956 RepID=A0A4S4M918_9APHY|nr:hypothetical protein EUX98_g8481 [Antrodiella citrinella]